MNIDLGILFWEGVLLGIIIGVIFTVILMLVLGFRK